MQPPFPIQFDDIKPLLPQLLEIEDPITREYQITRIEKNYHRYVGTINKMASDITERWPEANAVQIFKSYLLSQDTEDFLEHIKDHTFRLKVRDDLKKENNIDIPEDMSVKADESAYRHDEEIVDNILRVWEQSRLDKFRDLYLEYWDNISKTEFAGRVGLQLPICEKLIQKLKDEGMFDAPVKKQKRHHRQKEEKDFTKEELIGITFIKGDEEYRLGLTVADPDENPMNPLPGVPDPLTQKPMKFPMICPEFYVLDKNTWTKRISTTHTHPYLNTHMVSKRDLIPLTIDNFEKYKNKLRNLDCSQYNL